MSVSDILALVALIVSVIAVAAPLYLQYFVRRRVAVALGNGAYIFYGPAGETGGYSAIGLYLSVSLINTGASDALVTVMDGSIDTPDQQLPIRWSMFLQNDTSSAKSSGWTSGGTVCPIAATSRKVVTQWVAFYSPPLAAPLTAGTYQLELRITETQPQSSWFRGSSGNIERLELAGWTGDFTLTDEQLDFMRDHCVTVDGSTPDSCEVNLHRTIGRYASAGMQPTVPSGAPADGLIAGSDGSPAQT
jgi:hypothetical protein